jgi:triacylglycerol lipase
MTGKQSISERVVVVHGLAANNATTWLLSRRLRRQGFQVTQFGYPSILQTVEGLAERFEVLLRRMVESDSETPLHLVTHSMGGVLTRVVLESFHPDCLGRVVMLGTPNQGSHAARRLAPILGRLCYPLVQLSDAPHSEIHQYNIPDGVSIGIIAGSRDRVVDVEATHLAVETDHFVVPTGHGRLLFRSDVARQVAHFLKSGRFVHDPKLKSTAAA